MYEQLLYGRINKTSGYSVDAKVEMAASQTIKAQSGRFVYLNASGQAVVVSGAVPVIFGHLEAHDHSPSQGDKFNCDLDNGAIFRIPVKSGGTYTIATNGRAFDLDVTSNIQTVDLDSSAIGHVIVVNGDAEDSAWVDVMVNPAVLQFNGGVKEVIASGAIAAGDLVYINGIDPTTGLYKAAKADADAPTAPANFVAPAAISDTARGFVVGELIVTSVDTSGASAAGDPVYLSTTAGGWAHSAPSGAATVVQLVGAVITKHASTGSVKLFPGLAHARTATS